MGDVYVSYVSFGAHRFPCWEIFGHLDSTFFFAITALSLILCHLFRAGCRLYVFMDCLIRFCYCARDSNFFPRIRIWMYNVFFLGRRSRNDVKPGLVNYCKLLTFQSHSCWICKFP